MKGITKTVENEAEKKGFLRMLLGTLGTNLLRNMLTGKEWKRILRAVCWSGPSIIDLRFLKKLIPLFPLANFEIQKYYQNESRFNEVYLF